MCEALGSLPTPREKKKKEKKAANITIYDHDGNN
jgi:hypothetical protein